MRSLSNRTGVIEKGKDARHAWRRPLRDTAVGWPAKGKGQGITQYCRNLDLKHPAPGTVKKSIFVV